MDSAENIPLVSYPDGLHNATEEHKIPNSRHSDISNRLVFWACIGAICSSILSFIVFAGGTLFAHTPSVPALYSQPFRRPNPYINLDKVLQNKNYTFPPITNFPPMVLQVSTSDPKRKMTEDDRQHMTHYDTVYPDDRHILVSSEASTIVQFRNMDFAMENCVLTASLPRHTEPLDPATSLKDPSTVDVWILDSIVEISRYIPSTWEHAPARRTLLATLTFSEGGPSNSSEFRCPSNQFTTLELACALSDSGCRVDFWQDRRAVPRGGVYMTQYQSNVQLQN